MVVVVGVGWGCALAPQLGRNQVLYRQPECYLRQPDHGLGSAVVHLVYITQGRTSTASVYEASRHVARGCKKTRGGGMTSPRPHHRPRSPPPRQQRPSSPPTGSLSVLSPTTSSPSTTQGISNSHSIPLKATEHNGLLPAQAWMPVPSPNNQHFRTHITYAGTDCTCTYKGAHMNSTMDAVASGARNGHSGTTKTTTGQREVGVGMREKGGGVCVRERA